MFPAKFFFLESVCLSDHTQKIESSSTSAILPPPILSLHFSLHFPPYDTSPSSISYSSSIDIEKRDVDKQ